MALAASGLEGHATWRERPAAVAPRRLRALPTLPRAAYFGSTTVGDNRVDIVLDDGGTSSIWWATKNEWLGLIEVAGLELEALYGRFAREPFTDESREYVFIVRRPA